MRATGTANTQSDTTGQGHRLLPHTADVRLEAWAPTREGCLAEAVRALAETFVDRTTPAPTTSMPVTLAATTDIDLLVALLEEALYATDVLGLVPLDAHLAISPADGALTGHVDAARVEDLVQTGSAPKAVTRWDLRFGPDEVGVWRCLVTLDV